MFPGEGKFKYEIPDKGEPWLNSDLTAPFDFSIHKTNVEIQQEKDTLLKFFRPYFNYDTLVWATQLEKFRNEFNNRWLSYTVNTFGLKNSNEYFNNPKYQFIRNYQKYWEVYIINLLHPIYTKGIVDIVNPKISGKSKSIMLIKNKVAEEVMIDNFYTLKSAYKYLVLNVNNKLSSESFTQINYSNFFQEFDLNNFLTVNVSYDDQHSKTFKESLFDKISLTKGKIVKGQTIVSKGDIITPERYQILQSLKTEYEEQLDFVETNSVIMARLLLVYISLFVIFLFLFFLRKEILFDIQKIGFILLQILIFLFIASTVEKQIIKQENLVEGLIYFIPFAIVPILLRTFFDERLSIFVHYMMCLLIGLFLQNSFDFAFITFIVGIIAVFSMKNIYHRSRIVVTAFLVVLTYIIVYFSKSVERYGNLHEFDFTTIKWFGINGILILLAFPLIYVFEKSFGFLSDASLVELSDTNQSLLRELADKAPGTFQHSLQVANLAEAAIRKIGGNPLLVRAGALYHDIGKMENPIYFIENQTSNINPHDKLSFEDSAKIIISHVEKGVEISKKYKLPSAIVDFIKTHHGTSTVQYFYRSYIKKYPEKEVDVKKFSYPGPKPFSKETAVVTMADSVEAASHSLKNYSEKSIEMLVDSIINSQLIDEQFNNADITFKNITQIKEVFKKRLLNIYHVRISYPA